MKTGYTPTAPGHHRHHQHGQALVKRRRQYRKNRAKARIQHHLWYQKNKHNPAFKRRQKQRRLHPAQFRMRRAEYHTDEFPPISFVMGPNMDLGHVTHISLGTGEVLYDMEEFGPSSMKAMDFLKAVMFLSSEETDQMFSLIDESLGAEAYAEWDIPLSEEVIKVAGRIPLTTAVVEGFRKEFLLLMKNIGRVLSAKDLQRWRDAVFQWRERFNRFGYQIREDLKGRIREGESKPSWDQKSNVEWAKHYLEKMNPFWQFSSALLDNPVRSYQYLLDQDMRMWGTTFTADQYKERASKELVRLWLENGMPWASKVKRKAPAAWTYLKDLTEWTERGGTHGGGKDPVVLTEPTVTNTNIEGFQIQFVGFEESNYPTNEYLISLRAGLARYKERANKVLPWLLRFQLPIRAIWAGDTDAGEAAATYERNHIDLKFFGLTGDPGRMTHVLAHEMGHHIWKNVLSGSAQNMWSEFIKGDYKELDLREVMKGISPTETVFEFGDRIEKEDPILHIQIESLHANPSYKGFGIYGLHDVKDHLEAGKDPIVHVPANPITGYSAKSPEEAFCEALGKLVAWGPRTVPDHVSWLMKRILPDLKLSSMASRVATRWVDSRMDWNP